MPFAGFRHSDESIQKMADANKGKHFSPATEFKKGHKLSAETRKRMSISRTGAGNPRWNGGKANAEGYTQVRAHGHPHADHRGYVREHRIVIEKQIGRYLKPSETVHHLKGKSDNNPRNLILFANHSAHVRFEQGGIVDPSEIIYDGRKMFAEETISAGRN